MPSLSTDITNTVLLLKEYVVDNAYSNIQKEEYADSTCKCLMNKIKVSVAYIGILECYEIDGEYNCLTESEIRLLIQKSKKIINSRC